MTSSLYICQSVRKGNTVRSVNVKSLGRMDALLAEHDNDPDKVMAWAQAKLNELDSTSSVPVNIPFFPDKLIAKDERSSFLAGYLFLQDIYYKLKMKNVFRNIRSRYKFQYDIDAIFSDLIYARVLEPGSKRSSYDTAASFLEPPRYALHDIYQALSVLAKELDFIQAEVYKNSNFIVQRNNKILYYDCTNYFFEIEESDDFRQYGKSKENRPNPIVQMGMFIDGDGIPLAFSKSTDTAIAEELLQLHPMDRLKAIFISHTHHDHVMDMPFVAKKTGAMVYGTSSALNVARGGDVPEEQLAEFQDGMTYNIGDYSIRVIKSLHSKPTILNNDLGVPIEQPLRQPAKLRDYKEGGSYDFYVESKGKRILIRTSFNYIKGQLDGYQADVLFLGVAGLAKADEETERIFFQETVEKVQPKLVIPLHWDNFFSPLDKPIIGMPFFIENTNLILFRLAKYCEAHDINCLVQLPRTSIEL